MYIYIRNKFASGRIIFFFFAVIIQEKFIFTIIFKSRRHDFLNAFLFWLIKYEALNSD